MMAEMKKKSIGFVFVALAALFGLISCIRFVLWAPAYQAVNPIILIGLIGGIALDIVLFFRDNSYIAVGSSALYSIAAIQLLSDSAGSFADAYQGIVMFGDATQVGTIVSICALIGVSVLCSIIASFTARTKT